MFGDHPEALLNTVRIAERCNVDLGKTVNHLPDFDVPAGYTLDEYFEKMVWEGFGRRLPRLERMLVGRRAAAHDRRVPRRA